MNGANALIRTLVDAGVDVCFMNPGTSEMHFVAALDDVPEMRGVLALFEGVATGAADGYARIAGKPAATLLHLGPGLGNGLANLHNARKAFTPIVNIVGDHATYHKQYDAQLESDIETVARNVSSWIRFSDSTKAVASDAADAVAAAIGPPGQVATLILPADVSWSDGGDPAARGRARPRAAAVDAALVAELAAILAGRRAGAPVRRRARVPGRRPRRRQPHRQHHRRQAPRRDVPRSARARRRPGARRPPRLPRRVRRHAARRPAPPDPRRHQVARVVLRLPRQGQRPRARGLHRPRARRPATATPPPRWPRSPTRSAPRPTPPPSSRPSGRTCPTGALTADAVCQIVGALLPEGAIVSDEGNTSGLFAAGHTAGAPAHDWLCLTGGAIGQGLPVAARRGRGRAGPARDRAPGRRLGDVHAPVVVDDGPRAARRHHDPLQQLVLRGPQHGAPAGRRHRGRREGQGHARPPRPRARLRGPRHRHGRPGHPGHDLRGLRRPAPQRPRHQRAPR